MKKGIHPNFQKSIIKCACGNVMETMSIKPEMHVEICSACHPYFTGKSERNVDTTGRVEKFKNKYGKINKK
ncbi:MAG: 50S ribosomal protein L31 [Spirochaetales bacterium]|jgi:large subunit ribosomal protein L31|nr:50S ribosomal protein L31 [Exilispira sp.]NMC67957.1 50S ribosomal protein L31 [Spirochaetales bacterium]